MGTHSCVERLEELQGQEQLISARRRRLHRRIEFLRTNGNADGTRATPEQLAALDAKERELSAGRRALHAQIDKLKRDA